MLNGGKSEIRQNGHALAYISPGRQTNTHLRAVIFRCFNSNRINIHEIVYLLIGR